MSAARRFLVYGVTGSGKTMLARQVAHRTGLPLHEADALTWRAGWEPVPEGEQRAIFERVCRHDACVLDHAYGGWRDVPIKHADVLVLLDYPRWVSLWRLVRRTATRVATRRPGHQADKPFTGTTMAPDNAKRPPVSETTNHADEVVPGRRANWSWPTTTIRATDAENPASSAPLGSSQV